MRAHSAEGSSEAVKIPENIQILVKHFFGSKSHGQKNEDIMQSSHLPIHLRFLCNLHLAFLKDLL